MTLDEIIEIADRAYPYGLVSLYHRLPNGNHGDTLAQFIVNELTDTYDDKVSSGFQLVEARNCLVIAQNDLRRVTDAFLRAG